MTDSQLRGNPAEGTVRARIRLDFRGTAKPGKIFFRGKSVEKIAEEIREQNVAAFRNIPLQGIRILDIDIGTEVYTVFDEFSNNENAYAPIVLDVAADSLEDLVKLVARDDFRKIEVLSPGSVTLSRIDLERTMFRVAEELKHCRMQLERKYNLK